MIADESESVSIHKMNLRFVLDVQCKMQKYIARYGPTHVRMNVCVVIGNLGLTYAYMLIMFRCRFSWA